MSLLPLRPSARSSKKGLKGNPHTRHLHTWTDLALEDLLPWEGEEPDLNYFAGLEAEGELAFAFLLCDGNLQLTRLYLRNSMFVPTQLPQQLMQQLQQPPLHKAKSPERLKDRKQLIRWCLNSPMLVRITEVNSKAQRGKPTTANKDRRTLTQVIRARHNRPMPTLDHTIRALRSFALAWELHHRPNDALAPSLPLATWSYRSKFCTAIPFGKCHSRRMGISQSEKKT